MRDWKDVVRQRLPETNLPPGTKEEVIAELASHFEDGENEASPETDGMLDRNARKWSRLARDIQRAKCMEGKMNHRTRSLWLPALATFLGASVSLAVCQFLGMRPQLVWVARIGMTFYWPWLATLPAFGAVGACLSRRAQGPAWARLAAGLSPALIMLTVMSLVLPWGLYIDGAHFIHLVAFGLAMINWVAIPAFVLFLGAMPFLGDERVGRPPQAVEN